MVAIFNPNLRLDFGYDQLGEAIAYRSLTQVNHILQETESRTECFEEYPRQRLSPVELAIGWPNGLQRLLDAGFLADSGFRLSMYMKDLRSIEMILAAETFPTEKYEWKTVLHESGRSSQQIEEVVVKSFARRRQALAALAIQELPEEVLSRLGVSNEKSLDIAAFKVYQELQEMGVDVPQNLEPDSSYYLDSLDELCYHDSSIYNALFLEYPPPSRRLLDSLYTNGFKLIDTLDAQGRTPLLAACQEYFIYRAREAVSLIRWLLDKGACPEFSCGHSYPNVLFYIATYWSKVIRDGPQPLTGDLDCVIRRSASLCNPLCPDGCQCYCSSAGCLPFYCCWNCDTTIGYSSHESCKSITSGTLFRFLDKWLSLCGLDEGQSELCYKEAFRLEVFDRLGMAHTCCRHHNTYDTYNGYRRLSIDEKDRKQLQEEDSELKEQLDLIIQAYQNRCNKRSGGLKDFWESCMQDLDRILPELVPEQRCKDRCLSWVDYHVYRSSAEYTEKERELLDMRMAKEKEVLAKRNYLGLDFIDVIRLHFADSLGSGSSDSDGNSATPSSS